MGSNERAFAIPMLCGLTGVTIAIMLQMLNDAGVIVDEFITGTIVLREVQLFVILIWLGLGVLLSAIQN